MPCHTWLTLCSQEINSVYRKGNRNTNVLSQKLSGSGLAGCARVADRQNRNSLVQPRLRSDRCHIRRSDSHWASGKVASLNAVVEDALPHYTRVEITLPLETTVQLRMRSDRSHIRVYTGPQGKWPHWLS
ncbi:hypothetical protein J6590_037673 [Homalodisca vitripennis]|nr:hypothetical protein J6590_037673 [Homalodisca vitripennis]